MTREYNYLTTEEREQFVNKGYIVVKNAMKKEIMDEWMSHMWTRLGMDPNDDTTWFPDYTTMPGHREVKIEDLCPEAFNKM